LYTSCIPWVAPIYTFYIFFDLSKKKKKLFQGKEEYMGLLETDGVLVTWLSMGLLGMDGILVTLLSHMGWGFGSIYAWDGASLSVISDLIQGLACRLVFGRMLGVGRVLSKTHFLVCLILSGSGKLPLRIIWNMLMVPLNGILFSPVCSMIGRWKP
jgi:hypothetical protein